MFLQDDFVLRVSGNADQIVSTAGPYRRVQSGIVQHQSVVSAPEEKGQIFSLSIDRGIGDRYRIVSLVGKQIARRRIQRNNGRADFKEIVIRRQFITIRQC